jgi:N-acetylglucosamine-6-sulfatase
MTIRHPGKRTLLATLTVLCAAALSFAVYELSASIGNAFAHELVAKLAGTAYFLAVAFGSFYVYLAASLDDAPFAHRVIGALATPFLWMTKECVRLFESHPLVECLYYYVNPLNLWLLVLVVLEMAVATLVVRRLRSNRGERTRVLTPAPVLAIAVSLSLVVGLYAWGRGENVYVLFLSGYRGLFGAGAAVRWDGAGDMNREIGPNHATGPSRGKRAQTPGDHAAPSGDRPDIVFILGDNHNARTMGCAGHPVIETPAMDRLAREGVRFENAFNTTSLCSPSRASILTGAYVHSHGVKNNHTPWTGEMPTFLEHLSDAGYATAFIGKWHMPGDGLPEMPFLDLFVSYTYREGQGAYFDCPMIVNGQEVSSRKPYITEEVTDYAIEFIEQAAAQPASERRPFAVYLSHRPGHPPYQAPEGIDGMYDQAEVSEALPPNVDSWWFGKTRGNVFQGSMMGSYFDQYRGYLETLTAMDADIGRLLERIDELGLTENTVVVYLGDNGMQWGTHGRHGIREPYEDSAKLPMIVRAPGLVPDPGTRRDQIALNIDIAPTFLELGGVDPPDHVDGESLVPILRDGKAKSREAFLMEFWRYYPENTPSYRGVRTERHKYIEFDKGRDPWLFDIVEDPDELRTLYGTAEGNRVLPEVLKMLERLQAGEGL